MSLGINKCNGKNNSKFVDAAKPQDSWEHKYKSTAGAAVAMWMFIRYLTKLVDNLVNNEEMSFVGACQDAYSKIFQNLHPWLVRQAAKLAMLAAGSKATLMQTWGVENVEEARPLLDNLTKLCDVLMQLLDARELIPDKLKEAMLNSEQ